MLCSTCGNPVPVGARFCPACGSPQTSVQSQAEERRIVTVLFADLVGFTTLAEHMDPEQVKRLVDGCFERLVEVVAEYGGRVDKILGDGMLVLFGAPVAHEDDPERAVRAGLRMQDALATHIAASGLARIDELRMRIGINTGEVLVGTLAGTDYTAMGDVVNLTSRLQAAAPPGGVLVGETTHGLTAHTFRYESGGELQARGREQTIVAWLALAPTAPPGGRQRRRRDIGFVGRADEMAIARSALDLTAQHHRGLVLNVVGDSGVGKSRLVDEGICRLRADGDVTVLEGACVPYGESNVWWPIAHALTDHLDLDPGLDGATLRHTAIAKASTMFPSLDGAEAEHLADVFLHLLGQPSAIDRIDPVSARSAIHHAVAQVLAAKAQEAPIVLSIDDLHWADPVLLELLDSLASSLRRLPFVLVTAMRPGSDLAWPPRTDRTTVLSLDLQPLTRVETDLLARELLSDDEPSAATLSELYDRSGGNPLFLIELVALTEAGGDRELPDSLRTLIAARLDQLTLEQRQVLENAAVLGTAGNMLGLEQFATALGQPDPSAVVHELDELGLLEVRGHRWEFRSDSVRDAAYQTLTKAARALRHAGVARFMAGKNVGLDDLAHHAASAAELMQELGSVAGLPADLPETAVQLLTTAAEKALESGSLRSAVRHSTRGLDLSHGALADDQRMARLHKVRATAEIEQRRFTEAVGDIDSLQAIANRSDDISLLAESHRLRGLLANVAGRADEARLELGAAVDLLRKVDRPDLLADALRNRGFIEMFTGSLADAEWFFGEADSLFRELDDRRGMAYVEQHRAWISFLSGDLPLARERLTHAAATHGQLGDRNGVGWAFGLLAFIEFFEGRWDEAESLAISVSREAELRGDEWAAAMMDTLRADLRLWQGKLEESHDLAEKARNRFKRLDDRFGLIQALAPLVRTQVALGRFAASQRSSEELVALAESGRQGPFPLMAVAGAAMHRGQYAVALATADRSIAEMDLVGANTFEPMVVRALALAQAGRIEEGMVAIDSVAAHGLDHPFTHAVAALVHLSAGDADLALEHAAAVAHGSGATYLDEVFAQVAAAGAYLSLGDHTQAALSAEAAVARAVGVGDVVATAIATAAFQGVTGHVHPAHDDRTPLGEGWENILRQWSVPHS
jgi:class 3 adenylate cyclase/tetratricopeptide (TPR) repeat protein